MAGDWIKMRTNLDTNPHVIEMAATLGLPELHVVGCCWKVWAWADSHTEDGNAIRVTDVTLDRFTGVTGFANALRNVGWLEGENGALCFPRFTEHNGQTAKKRGETAIRVAKHRNAKRVTDVTQKVLPEKRREEKSINKPPTPLEQKIHSPNVPETIKQTWVDWLTYKAERKEAYKPTGLKAAETHVSEMCRQHGALAVEAAIRKAMANGWKGWEQEKTFGSKQSQPEPSNELIVRNFKPVDWRNAAAP